MARGRKSSASNVVQLAPSLPRPRLNPPRTLTKAERSIFVETVAQHPHLKPGDATLVAAFAQASARSSRLARKENTDPWERSVRIMLALARALRLAPISGMRPEALGRKRAEQQFSYYDQMKADDDDGEE